MFSSSDKNNQERWKRRYGIISLFPAFIAMALSVLTLCLWGMDKESYILSSTIVLNISFNSAMTVMFIGLSIVFLYGNYVVNSRLFAIAAMMMGVITFITNEYVVDVSVQNVLESDRRISSIFTMINESLNTIACYLITSLVLIGLSLKHRTLNVSFLLLLVNISLILISVIALIDGLTNRGTLYGFVKLTQMTSGTAATIALLNMAIYSMIRATICERKFHQYLKWPALVYIFALALSLVLWQGIGLDRQELLSKVTTSAKQEAIRQIETMTRVELNALKQIASRWEGISKYSLDLLDKDISQYFDEFENAKAVWLLDQSGVIRYEYNKNNYEFMTPRKKVSLARYNKSGKLSADQLLTIPRATTSGVLELLVVMPVYKRNKYFGQLIVDYDLTLLLDSVFNREGIQNFNKMIMLNQKVIYPSANKKQKNIMAAAWMKQGVIKIAENQFQIMFWPNNNLMSNYISPYDNAILILGLITSVILVVCMRLYQNSRKHEMRYNAVLNTVNEGIYAIDNEGKLLFYNTKLKNILGYHDHELQSEKFYHLVKPEQDNPNIEDNRLMDCHPKQGQRLSGRNDILTTKWGKKINIEFSSEPCNGVFRENNTLIVSFRDVTKKKEVEKKIDMQTEYLKSFSYSVSHDLRAPLRHISGFIDLIASNEDTTLDDKAKHHFEIIKTAAEKMSNLIDDMLRYSRSMTVPLKFICIDLNEVANEVKEQQLSNLDDRIIEIDIQKLPTVMGDRSMLYLVVSNLVSNAIKFSKNRDVAKISISSAVEKGYYRIVVKDNGVGFDDKYKHKLFSVFQRLHTQDEFEGTGVGLASVERLIVRHGGSVLAHGEVGVGAEISFTLPIKQVP